MWHFLFSYSIEGTSQGDLGLNGKVSHFSTVCIYELEVDRWTDRDPLNVDIAEDY